LQTLSQPRQSLQRFIQSSSLAQHGEILHGLGVAENLNSEKSRRDPPWLAGVRAARANALPALCVQSMMVLLLIAYYQHPPTHAFLNQLADLKQRLGYIYTSASAIVAAAIIPELLRIVFFQKGRIHRKNGTNLFFTIPFWGVMSITVDLFYQLQAWLFGTSTDFATVAMKVTLDQLGYTALFATPVTCILYDWKHNQYRLRGLGHVISLKYYREAVFPVLLTNWAVWIPMITVIYSLPLTLQVPIFGLALSMWVLLYTWMSESRHHGVGMSASAFGRK